MQLPTLPFGRTLKQFRELYVAAHQTHITYEQTALSLGYASYFRNGAAIEMVKNLLVYGLIEEVSTTMLKISPLGALVANNDRPSFKTATLFPTAFKTLFRDRLEGAPESVSEISERIISIGFPRHEADKLAFVFWKNLEFLRSYSQIEAAKLEKLSHTDLKMAFYKGTSKEDLTDAFNYLMKTYVPYKIPEEFFK